MRQEARSVPWRTNIFILAVLMLCMRDCAWAQQQSPPQSQPSYDGRQAPPTPSPEAEWNAQQQKEMAKKQNTQRQDDIKKDAEKLLELATELKQSVDKSTENTLSLDVIKKAEQIEKLAKAVKEKMKGP